MPSASPTTWLRPGSPVIGGHEIPDAQRLFAHHLIDVGAVDLIHGHSSHHFKPVEVYRNKVILYGCGDFIDDYVGIRAYEEFRDDLVLMYFAKIRLIERSLPSSWCRCRSVTCVSIRSQPRIGPGSWRDSIANVRASEPMPPLEQMAHCDSARADVAAPIYQLTDVNASTAAQGSVATLSSHVSASL